MNNPEILYNHLADVRLRAKVYLFSDIMRVQVMHMSRGWGYTDTWGQLLTVQLLGMSLNWVYLGINTPEHISLCAKCAKHSRRACCH